MASLPSAPQAAGGMQGEEVVGQEVVRHQPCALASNRALYTCGMQQHHRYHHHQRRTSVSGAAPVEAPTLWQLRQRRQRRGWLAATGGQMCGKRDPCRCVTRGRIHNRMVERALCRRQARGRQAGRRLPLPCAPSHLLAGMTCLLAQPSKWRLLGPLPRPPRPGPGCFSLPSLLLEPLVVVVIGAGEKGG